MAYEFYVSIEGTKQGKFKGDSPRDAWKDKIAGLSFDYLVKSPRDIATGQASGKRQHGAIKIMTEWGPHTPQAFNALVTNEVLKNVLFEFIKTNPNGEEYVYYTVKLTQATISELRMATGPGGGGAASATSAKHTSGQDTHEVDEISFTFQKIEMEDKDKKTMASDDWHK